MLRLFLRKKSFSVLTSSSCFRRLLISCVELYFYSASWIISYSSRYFSIHKYILALKILYFSGMPFKVLASSKFLNKEILEEYSASKRCYSIPKIQKSLQNREIEFSKMKTLLVEIFQLK